MRNKIILKNALSLITFLLFNTFYGYATTETPSIFDQLSYQETVEVTLEMDMESVFGNRRNTEKHKAIFSYNDKNGSLQTWNIKVALRGRFRRTKCEGMAPLKLNFKKGDLKEAGLAKFDDMKLVTHCVADKKKAKQLLVKEYLAYKMYNQISENSFRVQFLKINYKDSTTGEVDEQWGILIEDTAEMRARIGVEKTKTLYNLTKESFDTSDFKTVAFFQYMIGNLDWSPKKIHNVKLLNKDGKYILVPYDFDFSTLVKAPYARLNPEFQMTSSQSRFYLGFKDDLDNYDEMIQIFESKKDDILQTIRDNELLSKRNKREMVKYVKSFYNEIENIVLPENTKIPSTLGD